MSQAEQETKSGIRPVQVVAAGLAALTAAFLGSTLGVYGTVIGAGLVSVLTTIGGEIYLRSLERTAQAARRTREIALTRTTREPGPLDDPTVELLARPEPRRRVRLRWPLIAGASLVAFVLGMVVVTGIEGLTGRTLSGGAGSTLGRVVTGGGSPEQAVAETPVADEAEPVEATPSAPATTTTTTTSPAPDEEPSSTPANSSSSPAEPTEEPSETGTTTLVPSISP